MNERGVSEIEIDELGERIASIAASLDAATHRLLTDLREFDRRKGWGTQGMLSCAHWLSWKCGIALGAAREKVRVAHALAKLPRMDDELRRGRLSFSKVRAMTRVATPENEVRLVELALGTTAEQLEKICRFLDQQEPRDPQLIEERRWLRTRDVSHGMVRIEAQLRPEEAARVIAACDVFAGSAVERADALVTMAEATLRGDRPDRPPVEVVVHVDAETLTGSEGAAGISAETSRRLLCDAAVATVTEDAEGTPLDAGRKKRVFAGALRRALLARAGGHCEFPSCTHTRYLHGHHVRHWIDGGETSMSNGLLLCTRHHQWVHEGDWRVIEGPRFFRPDGRELVDVPVPARPSPLEPVEETPPIWDGDRVDYDAVVEYAMR